MDTSVNALVAGDTGIIGRHIVSLLRNMPGCDVTGLSRSPATDFDYAHLSADLSDPRSLTDALKSQRDVTHLFYVGRAPMPDAAVEAELNGRMLANVVTATRDASPGLEHVHLMEGMKWYGSHLGAWKTPAREDDARHMPPNMYYTQQDWLEQWSRDNKVSWSALRPHQVCGVSDRYPHNVMGVIAVYGSICRELGQPLCFPGTTSCFNSVSMVTDASLLARAMLWCATTPAARNRALNVGNGDYFRWSGVWPLIAEFFGLEDGGVKTLNMNEFMQDKAVLWRDIATRNNLIQADMDQLVNWQYGDFSFRAEWDDMASFNAIRDAGFGEYADTQNCFVELLDRYRSEKIIP